MINNSPLSPNVVDNLLDLRMLIERGVRAAQLGAPADENLALVILDGANERATLIAASEFSTKIDNSFEGNLSRVVQEASIRGAKLPGVGEVIKLHKARNGVQHHGIKVNSGQLSLWASTTQLFIRAVVSHLYGIDIRKVWRGDAIRDTEIRNSFVEAEISLDQGEVSKSIDNACSAFDLAREKWARERRGLAGGSAKLSFSGRELLGADLWRQINDSISALDDYSEVQPFADDMGEYIWLKSIRYEMDKILGAQDGNRALDFIFWWIVRWETFSKTVVLDRREQWFKSQRLVRPSNEMVASIARVDLIGRSNYGWRVEVKLKDVPSETEYNEWASYLTRKLGKAVDSDTAKWWRIHDDGCLSFEGFLDSNLDSLASKIREVLTETHNDIIQRQKDVEAVGKDIKRREEQIWTTIKDRVPSWVTGISLPHKSIPVDPDCVLRVSSEISFSMGLHNKIRGDLLVRDCIYTRTGDIGISPELSGDQLLAVIERVSGFVDTYRKEESQKREDLARQQQEALTRLRSSFGID